MKRIALLIVIIVIILGCKTRINYYEGYICNIDKKPINGLKVFSEYDSIHTYSYTDNNGFFKIKKDNNIIFHFLMIKKDHTVIDSIQIIRMSGGERINYYFVEGRKDTLYIDASKYEK